MDASIRACKFVPPPDISTTIFGILVSDMVLLCVCVDLLVASTERELVCR